MSNDCINPTYTSSPILFFTVYACEEQLGRREGHAEDKPLPKSAEATYLDHPEHTIVFDLL